MMKRLAFVAGFGIGFVVGSASGRKSYESLRETALNTWNDPKVQAKVNEGADWVKSEVPVVGEKLAEGAQQVAGTVSAKAQQGADAAKHSDLGQKAQQGADAVKEKAQQGAAAVKDKAQDVKSSTGKHSDDLPKPVTTEKDVDMEPAHPGPDPEDMPKK